MNISTKLDRYESGVFSVMAEHKKALVRRGMDVIDLSVGTPDMPPSRHIIDALLRAAEEPGNYVYAIQDRPTLLQAAADWYARRFHVSLNPRTQILSLNGSQDGLSHVTLAIADPGDLVLVPDPGYPIFQIGPYLAGAELYYMPQTTENGYVIDLSAIPEHVARRARMMIVSYPNNPVAVCAPRSFYEELVAFADKYDIVVIHDNAYCELVFDGNPAGSFLEIPGAIDVGIELNSLSKTYSMPGCRCSFALGNERVISKLKSIKSHIDFGMFLPLQIAAEAALNGPQDSVAETREIYRRRRDVLVDGLNAAGWPVERPQGTMFVFAKLPGGARDSFDFCIELMNRTGVIAVPGVSFGPRGEGHVRFGLVQPEERLELAVRRIADNLSELGR